MINMRFTKEVRIAQLYMCRIISNEPVPKRMRHHYCPLHRISLFPHLITQTARASLLPPMNPCEPFPPQCQFKTRKYNENTPLSPRICYPLLKTDERFCSSREFFTFLLIFTPTQQVFPFLPNFPFRPKSENTELATQGEKHNRYPATSTPRKCKIPNNAISTEEQPAQSVPKGNPPKSREKKISKPTSTRVGRLIAMLYSQLDNDAYR